MNADKLGLQDNIIKIVPYDPDWAIIFSEEKLRILSVIKDYAIDIQHFGSTSVPGLPAKPIVDILIAIKDFSEIELIIQKMSSIGYEWFKAAGIQGDYTLGYGNPRQFWAHVVQKESLNWTDNLLFRDLLRSNNTLANAYLELKQNLAKNYRGIRSEYTKGKTAFVTNAVLSAKTCQPSPYGYK